MQTGIEFLEGRGQALGCRCRLWRRDKTNTRSQDHINTLNWTSDGGPNESRSISHAMGYKGGCTVKEIVLPE